MDTPIILLLLLLASRDSNSQNVELIHNVKSYLSGMQLDYKYTTEKIRMVKKIRPYLPSEYIDTVNKSVIITEKLIKLLEVQEFMQTIQLDEVTYVEMEPKDKMLKVFNIIQEDIHNSNIGNLGFALDLIANIDNYKNMFNLLTSVMKDKKSLNNPDSIMKLMEAFIGNSSPKDKEKIKELSTMMDIFKILDTPKKEIPGEN